MDGVKRTILCVDDEADIVSSLYDTFKDRYDVKTATSGARALSIFQREDVALVITDQRMPRMEGTELLAKIDAQKPMCKKILLTGYADVNAAIDAINRGKVDKYITKPWDEADLIKTVDLLIEEYELELSFERLIDKGRTLEGVGKDEQLADMPEILKSALKGIFISLSPIVGTLDRELQEAFQRIITRFGINLHLFFKIGQKDDMLNSAQQTKARDVLRRLSFFREASEYDLVCLARYMQELDVPENQILLTQNEPVEDVYFIAEGTVDILVDSELVADRAAGEAVGELSSLRNELCASATVRTRTPCKLLKISRTRFMEVVTLLPNIWKMLFDKMREHVVELNDRYSKLLSFAWQGVAKLDPQGRLTREISRQCQHFLAIPEGSNEYFSRLLFPDDPEAAAKWEEKFKLLIIKPSAEFGNIIGELPQKISFDHPELGN